jgi:Calcineurin-like phosphoesterase
VIPTLPFSHRSFLTVKLSFSVLISGFLLYAVEKLDQPIYALEDFNFAAVGDFGCNSNADDTVDNIVDKNPDLVFALGDYSYLETGTCWFNQIGSINNITRISIGNHEDDNSEGYNEYMDHFGLSQPYYSFNHKNVHILVLDTDRNNYFPGSPQYNYAVNDLQSASQDPDIDWIIVYFHRPMYASPSDNAEVLFSFGVAYHPLFDQYGVDLVLAGHIHNYQRTYPLNYNTSDPYDPIVTSTNANDYINPQGAIFAIAGTGGNSIDAIYDKESYVVAQQDDSYGQLDIKITDNGNKLEGKFYRNDYNTTKWNTISTNFIPVNENEYYNFSLSLSAKDVNQLHSKVYYYDSNKTQIDENQLHSKVYYYDSNKTEIKSVFISDGRNGTFEAPYNLTDSSPPEAKYMKLQILARSNPKMPGSYVIDNVQIEKVPLEQLIFTNNDKDVLSISAEMNRPISGNNSLRVDVRPGTNAILDSFSITK